MSIADVSLLVGPVGALVLVPTALVLLALGRRPKWALWVSAALLVVVVTTWLGYWINWGWAFNYADALQEVPASLQDRMLALEVVSAVAVVALVVAAGASHRRTQQHA